MGKSCYNVPTSTEEGLKMSWTPLQDRAQQISAVTNIACILARPDYPESLDPRNVLYLEAVNILNDLRDTDQINDVFFDYLYMHLNDAYTNGGQ